MDLIHGEVLKESKKVDKDNLNRKGLRKLEEPGYIKINFASERITYWGAMKNTKLSNWKLINKIVERKDNNPNINNYDPDIFYDRPNGEWAFWGMYNYTLYFSEETKTLTDLFDGGKDNGIKELSMIDLTEFDISVITSFENAFRDLPKLQKIIFPTNKKAKPTVVTQMFSGCSSLKSVDLSMFDLSECTSYASIFSGASALQGLMIQSFNFPSDDIVKNIFNGLNLNYLDIRNVDGATTTIKNYFTNKNSLTVCQTTAIIPSKIERCCEYYNSEEDNKCTVKNFIGIYYKQDCEYTNGFHVESQYRQNNYMVKHNKGIVDKSTKFSISAGDKLEIYFLENQNNLERFFSQEEDPNMQYVYSIDLSKLVTTSLTKLNSLFYNSSSIEIIYLTNFDTSKVTDMSQMFSGCSSLKALYMSNSIPQNAQTTDMFKDVKNLIYLDIKTFNDAKKVITSSPLNQIEDLKVCQSGSFITNSKRNDVCCTINLEKNKCSSSNYITVTYQNDVSYEAGKFPINRNNIAFLNIGKKSLGPKNALSLPAETEIEIHFSSPLSTLKQFFDASSDSNCEQLKSVQFTNFNSQSLTDMSKIFYGCTNIKSIDLSNLITSKVKSMTDAFYNCQALRFLNV